MMLTVVRAKGFGAQSANAIASTAGLNCVLYGDCPSEGDVFPWGLRSGRNTYNKFAAMKLNGQKGVCRAKLATDGVPVPKVVTSHTTCTFPVIARPQQHHKGQNFYILYEEYDLMKFMGLHPDYYYAEKFEKNREIRVHCAHGKVLFVKEKPLADGVTQANQAVTHESWRTMKWSEFENDALHKALRAALDAVRAIGLDFGGVDVMVNDENGEVAVCEVNTAPTLDGEYSAGKYASYAKWLSDGEREHWNYQDMQKAKSLFWKKAQLGVE
jgi:hypothetical protein